MREKKRKKKIAAVVTTARCGGVAIAWRDIIKNIKSKYHLEVYVWFSDGPVARELRKEGVSVTILDANSGMLKSALKFLKDLRAKELDIVFTMGIRTDNLLRIFRRYAKVKYLVSTIPGLTCKRNYSNLRLKLYNLTNGLVDKYLFNSQNNSLLYATYPRIREKIEVMKLGINVLPEDKVKLFTRHRGKDGKFRMICVANMSEVKNHPFLLELFRRYRDEFDNVDLYLMGNGLLKDD